MTRLTRVLIAIIAAELLGITILAAWPQRQSEIPVPDFTRLDSVTRTEIQAMLEEVKKNRPGTLQTLADRYMALGYFTEAELCFRMIIEQTPQSFDAALHHGICLDRLGQIRLAIEEYRRAASLAKPGQRPSAQVCLYHAGRCCLREENTVEAERTFRETGDFPLGQFQLARLFARTDRFDEALAVLSPLMATYPGELKLILLKASIARSRNNDNEADELVEQCERAVDRFFVDSTIEFLGLLRTEFGIVKERAQSAQLAAAGKVPEAIRRLQESLLAEWDLQTAVFLVDLHLRQRDPNAAGQLLDELTKRAGLIPETLERRGDAYVLNEKPREAAEAWLHAVRLRPTSRIFKKLASLTDPSAQNPLSREYDSMAVREAGIEAYRSNSLTQAKELLARAVNALPQDARSWFYLAAACRASGDLQEAAVASDHYRQLVRDSEATVSGDAKTLP